MLTTIEKKLQKIYAEFDKKILELDDFSLMIGSPGVILFLFEYEKKFNNKNKKSSNYFKKMTETFETALHYPFTFANGLAGTYWLLNYLNDKKYIKLDTSEIEIYLQTFLGKNSALLLQEKNIDYLHGLGGFYVPFTDTSKQNDIDVLLSAFELKENKLLMPYKYSMMGKLTDNSYNMGLAHGYPSYIRLLTLNSTNNLYFEQVCQLKNVVDSSKLNAQKSLYPFVFHTDEVNTSSRLAWCYGDLGIAASFWLAGKKFDQPQWQEEAVQILQHSTKRRNLEENQVLDAAFCHGAAGIAHIYNRYYKETGLKEFDDARWYWLNQTLQMATYQDGLAGFKSLQGKQGYQNNYSLLEGIAGIGMVLLGFLTDDIKELNWDRCMLLS